MTQLKPHIAIVISSLLLIMCLTACSTGIEGTKSIKMSRAEQRNSRPGPEELFAAAIRPDSLPQWKAGKRFLVSDNRANMIYEPAERKSAVPGADDLEGKILLFKSVSSRPTPGGNSSIVIELEDSAATTYIYNTGRTPEKSQHITGLDMPMLIDLDLVEKTDSLMRGKHLWTMSRLWYDSMLNETDGRKYVPVTIQAVRPGNMVFPLRVDFTDENGKQASMLMNAFSKFGSSTDSRTFANLFSLSDPKLKHQSITPEFWNLICEGKVAIGMTKEECRLALGNPSDAASGHSWSALLDVWNYKDGTFLQFQDGLLINYRH